MRSMDPEIEMEIRLNVVPIILSNLRDKTSRLTHEEILVQNFTSLCELVGPDRVFARYGLHFSPLLNMSRNQ